MYSVETPMSSQAPSSLRLGLVACLVVLWALVCGAWMGPKASLAQCLVPFIGGLLVAAWGYLVREWICDEFPDEGAPGQSNIGWLWSLALVFVLIGLGIAWQVCIAEPLRKFRKWQRDRTGHMDEAELQDRVKALRHERPKGMRF